jgi:hypothetical protein
MGLHQFDRGYEILLIKPYYSSLVKKVYEDPGDQKWMEAYAILTVLDLLQFPMRGVEQAETLFRKVEPLKRILNWSALENAIG